MKWKRFLQTINNLIFSGSMRKNMKNVYQRQHLKRGPRLVTVGGGTGLSVLLRGLKEYTSNITAIVSVADDGGSSGRLRGQLGVLPPGDLRDCLVALADTESAMENLFNYRFTEGGELAGHSLGNLLLVALADLTGSFETALREAGKVLAIRGKVVPTTFADLKLGAELVDGSILMGQSFITKTEKHIKRVFLKPANCRPTPEAIKAIREAEMIVLGPGSLYTSIIPNLLVPGITEEIKRASGIKVYVCNVMTQVGETRGYTAAEHLEALYEHTLVGLVDYLLVNNQSLPAVLLNKYWAEGVELVNIDKERLSKMSIRVIEAPLLKKNDFIRHDSAALAAVLFDLLGEQKAIGW
jgi:uncharacterized cofD-like protein